MTRIMRKARLFALSRHPSMGERSLRFHSVILSVVVSLLVAVPSTGAHNASTVDTDTPQVVRVETVPDFDFAQALDAVRSNGSLHLRTELRDYEIQLRKSDIFGEFGFRELTHEENGNLVPIGAESVFPFHGQLADNPGSRVHLTFDVEHSVVAGIIILVGESGHITFNPEQPDFKIKWVTNVLTAVRPPTDQDPQTMPDGPIEAAYVSTKLERSIVYYDSVLGADLTWKSRYVTAWDLQSSMWYNQPLIKMQLVGYAKVGNSWFGGCGNILTGFQDFLQLSGFNDDVETHQMASGVNFDEPCIGLATAKATFRTKFASSILEVRNHVEGDGYDPNQADDLGLLSAAEMIHVNGDQYHHREERCEKWFLWYCTKYSYNIMANYVNYDDMNFWMTVNGDTLSPDTTEGRVRTHARPQLPLCNCG